MAPPTKKGSKLSSLESRLRRVQGISDLTVELGDEGLKGIRVRIEEGSSEADILEEIRRILVAYGLRSRRAPSPVRVTAASLPEEETFSLPPQEPGIRVLIEPDDGGLQVVIHGEGRRVSTQADASALGAAEAMVRAVAAWTERQMPERVALLTAVIDNERVLIVLTRKAGRAGIGAAIVGPSLSRALHAAVSHSLEELDLAS